MSFQHPVIVGFSHDQWRFQPTTPVTGNTKGADLPISWEDSRAAELHAIDDVKGEYTIGAFNVLNYFTSLGEEFGGSAYTDREGNKVTVNRGKTRGAYTQSALEDQSARSSPPSTASMPTSSAFPKSKMATPSPVTSPSAIRPSST